MAGGGRIGYEGVRVFDVTDPAQPQFIDMIQTACGSHTHTLIADGQQAIIYVSSYPLRGSTTRRAKTWTHSNPQTQEAWQVP